MLHNYTTTEEFVEAVRALGLKTEENEPYGVKFIDIKDKSGEIIAYVDVDVQGKMSVRRITDETTVTTNKKAAKAYDTSGVYDAKELAEKQGFALRAEVINAAN